MDFFCFYEFLRILKCGPYIRVYNAIFLTYFIGGGTACKAPDDSVYRNPGSPHHRLAMADRGIDCDPFIHPVISKSSRLGTSVVDIVRNVHVRLNSHKNLQAGDASGALRVASARCGTDDQTGGRGPTDACSESIREGSSMKRR